MKTILGITAGVLLGSMFLMIFGAIGASLSSPLPEDFNISDTGYNAMRVAATPVFSWLLTLTGIILGSFFAGVIGTAITKDKTAWVTSVIGGILSLWVLYEVYAVPEIPLWYDISSLISYLLFTYLGGVVMR